jgi:hypothetical protein
VGNDDWLGLDVGCGDCGDCEGAADADAEAEGDAAFGAAWLLLLIDDRHPATDNAATIASTMIAKNIFSIQVPLDEISSSPR